MKKEKIISMLAGLVMSAIVLSVGLLTYYCPQVEQANSTVINGCIYAGDLDSNCVSLMINVYWGTEYIEPILEILEEKNVKCTFFVGGIWAKDNQQLLKKIYQSGHEIASHGYSHKEHEKLSLEQNLSEMQKTHDIVKNLIDYDITLFAPPGGSYNSLTVEASKNMGYQTIMWTRDTIDWRDQNTQLIYNRAIKEMKSGDLILMHPKEKTVEALPLIIDYALDHQLKVTTVSETIGKV